MDPTPLLTAVRQRMDGGHGVHMALAELKKDPTVPPLLLGHAHRALCTADGRHFLPAIDAFARANAPAELTAMLHMARAFRHVAAVTRLNRLGHQRNIPALVVPDFLPWLKRTLHFLANVQTQEQQEATTDTRTSEERFRTYAAQRSITILHELQRRDRSRSSQLAVFLAQDMDGIIKVFKELPNCRIDWFGRGNDTEPEMTQQASGVPGIPRYFGVTTVDPSLSLLRIAVAYGAPLTGLMHDGPVPWEDACTLIGRLATTLAALHARNIAHMDLRPENIIIDGREVHLLDLGDARRFPNPRALVTINVQDPHYAPPEVVERAMGGAASDIFQLGILFHQLHTGQHPFAAPIEPDAPRALRRLHNTLANTLCPMRATDPLIMRMLAHNPDARPSAQEVANALRPSPRHRVFVRYRTPLPSDRRPVLFPARMGVPHRGHIDFLSRILELGHPLIVSFQRTYFHSEDDPIPKWIVQKMVAKSLERRGFDLNNVQFLCTPFFATGAQHQLHFAMMPGRERLAAVASGNPEVHALFGGQLPLIDQHMVFGTEDERYETRSWGAQLRKAIRNGDEETIHDLAASGVADILSPEELREICCSPPTASVVWGHPNWGSVFAAVQGENLPRQRERVGAYSTPEDTVLCMLPGAAWTARFDRCPALHWNGHTYRLHASSMELDTKRNLHIAFQLIS